MFIRKTKIFVVLLISSLLLLIYQNCSPNNNESTATEPSEVFYSADFSSTETSLNSENSVFINNLSLPLREQSGINLIESNSVLLRGLPDEGVILRMQEITPVEANTDSHFAVSVNNGPYRDGRRNNIRLFNGNKLTLLTLPSYYFDSTKSIRYKIGTFASGTWTVKTINNPGNLTAKFNKLSFATVREAAVGSTVVSDIAVVSGLYNNSVQVSLGRSPNTDVAINGIWQSSSSGAYLKVKNGDIIQLRHKVLNNQVARLYIYSMPTGEEGNTTISDKLDWAIFPKDAAPPIVQNPISNSKVSIRCTEIVLTINSESASCELGNLKVNDQIEWFINNVITPELNNLAQISTQNPQLGTFTFFARIKRADGSIQFTDTKRIIVR